MREAVVMRVGAGKHKLAPTYQARDAIETALRSSVYQVYDAHQSRMLMLREYAEIVCAGMEAGGFEAPVPDDVAMHLFEAGTDTDAFRRAVAEYLAALAWTPEDAKKKIEDDYAPRA